MAFSLSKRTPNNAIPSDPPSSPTPSSSRFNISNLLNSSNTSTPSRSESPRLSSPPTSPSSPQFEKKARSRIVLPSVTKARADKGVIALRYEETSQAKSPIPITIAPPRSPPVEEHPAFRSNTPLPAKDIDEEEWKRDSGVANTTGTGRSSNRGTTEGGSLKGTVEEREEGHVGKGDRGYEELNDGRMTTVAEPSSPIRTPSRAQNGKAETLGQPNGNTSQADKLAEANGGTTVVSKGSDTPDEFSPITTDIPTENLFGENFMDGLSFSNRGSVMFGGKKAVEKPNPQARLTGGRRQPSVSLLVSPTINVLSDEMERESQKVRSMYEQPSAAWEDEAMASRPSNIGAVLANGNPQSTNGHLSPHPPHSDRPGSAFSTRSEHRKEFELAGGIEDWQDVRGGDVDRYGFISQQRDLRPGTPEPRPIQRVSTVLQLASETPRKKRAFGRSPSTATSKNGVTREPSRKASARSLKTQGSNTSQRSNSKASFRAATNRLPGNRDRRWMDEAGDMLTLPPGLAAIAEDEEGGKAAASMKKKEFERTEKWRKMAKVIKTGNEGEGMHFEFDTKNPKLIERTWKGIPDRWRSEAWFSFLRTSARKRKDSPTEEAIIASFHKLLSTSSADDMQIDIDVPRTINSHIMFRRRYRGGQRLLFRVLHCLALYYPNTGYVQGMASLAATLLCYFDEEKCFIMLVRMWSLRGLDKLYEPGFPGLMACLDEFQKSWLDNHPIIASQLLNLSIDTTAYGTRWYLTLFNYSIPFAAQLRVWDVFMLLGDCDYGVASTVDRPFPGGWDVLHATAAALMDGTREILLDSDFENAMKVLTSWIPVRDEELLMRVAGAEYRARRKRR